MLISASCLSFLGISLIAYDFIELKFQAVSTITTNLDRFIRNYYKVRGLVPRNEYISGAPQDLLG